MKKEQILFFSIIVFAAGAAYYVLEYLPKKSKSKNDYIMNIVDKLGSNAKVLSSFESDFLKSWSNSLDSNSEYFIYNGNKYDGKYGTRII